VASLDEELDRLYRLPLAEFVPARNQIAAALKKSGDTDDARRVRELAKPSASAWAVNQLYWKGRPQLLEVIAAGDRYREAQRAALSGNGSELSEAERGRRIAIEEAVRRVRDLLEESGQAATDALLRRITTTLEAVASYGSGNPTPMRGRLSEDLESPGFRALSTLAPPPDAVRNEAERVANEIRREEETIADAKAALSKATARAEIAASALDRARAELARAEEGARLAASEMERARTLVSELEGKRRRRK
jgi:hypothetical protein